MKEIKVFRTEISTVTEGLKWSADGQLALNCGQHCMVLTPDRTPPSTESGADEYDEAYSQRATPSLDQHGNFVEEHLGGYYHDEQLSLMAYSTEHLVLDILWSPTGFSTRRSCLLAVLTTRGEVVIYESTGSPERKNETWRVKHHLNLKLVEDLKLEQPLRHQDALETRFHSVDWTAAYPWPGSKWGRSFMMLGAENHKVVVYQYDDEGLRYVGKWGNGLVGEWTTTLAIGPKSAANGEALACLISDENDVVVRKLRYDAGTHHLDIDSGLQLRQPSRLHVSHVRWWSNSQFVVLAMYQVGKVHVVLFDAQTLDHVSTMSIQGGFTTQCTGIVFYPHEAPHKIQLVAVSHTSELFTTLLDTANLDIVATPGADSTLSMFISRRKDLAEADSDVDLDMRLYSASPHPHGTYLAAAYSVYQARKLRYPVMSEHVRRVAFLCTAPRVSSQDVPLWSIMSGSAIGSWWEINVLKKSILGKQNREEFQASLIQRLSGEIAGFNLGNTTTENNLGQDLERSLLTNPDFDKMRLLQHYGYDHHRLVLNVLAMTTLNFVHNLGVEDLELTDLDRAMLQSYSHFVENPKLAYTDDLPKLIEIDGGFFREQFDFTKPHMDEVSIESERGNSWLRCSITLLPLLKVDVLTCGGCGRKAIKTDKESGKLVEVVLDTLDVCIYCGGRYYERA